MEEKRKRKAFTTAEQRNKAQQKYRQTEAGKMKLKIGNAKSQAKKYINEYATKEELEELIKLIKERMKKL
nr:hypothetical protein [uncultured Fusobacterium sp.]